MAPGAKLSDVMDNDDHYNDQFTNDRQQKIHCYYWKPSTEPRALLLICHGFTEHCMVYDHIAKETAKKGFFTFAHDNAGHGRSDGYRGNINDFNDVIDDAVLHIQLIRKKYPHLPLFLLGHSMGGSASILLSLKEELQVKGMVLIAPASSVNTKAASPFRISVARMISRIFPHCPMGRMDYSLSCSDEAKTSEMYQDPLRPQGYYKAQAVVSLLQAAEMVYLIVPEVGVPFCLLHGDQDVVCDIDGSKRLFEKAKSNDKFLKVYPGSHHCLHLEPMGVGEEVTSKTIQWLSERI